MSTRRDLRYQTVVVDHSPPLISVRLTAIRYAARDTHLYEVRSVDDTPLPDASPGAHIDVHLPNGMVRQYSLVEAGTAPRCYQIGVKLDPNSRGGSRYLHEQLRVGSVLQISPPRNNFALLDGPHETVLVAGGIGITPIWSMVQALHHAGRPWQLHYACRSREYTAFLDDLGTLGGRVHLHFDEEQGSVLDVGRIVREAPADAHLYCCGPAPLLAAFETAGAGRLPATLHVEYFNAAREVANEGGYVIELARSAREFTVPPGQTILGVLRQNGFDVPSSCEQGVCGACETAVLAGEIDHRDAILTPDERAANRTMMVCCSGSKSARLVLDL